MTAPTASDIAQIATNIIQAVEEHEDIINTIAGLAGVLPEVSLAEKALPAIIAVLQLLQGKGSASPIDALQALLNHITPGAPNAAALAPDVPQAS